MRRLVFVFAAFAVYSAETAPRPIAVNDILTWKRLHSAVVSNDGKWFAYRISPTEGDSELVVKNLSDGAEKRFPIGEYDAPGFAFPGARVAGIEFSEDSKWIAFEVRPKRIEARRARRDRKPVSNKTTLVELASMKTVEFEKAKSFAFAGERGEWLAVHRAGNAPAAPPTPPAAPASGAPPAPAGPTGTDLILHELATGNQLNLGNVAEYAFNKSGEHLALIIDAAEQAGNGVQLRDMTSGAVRPLDSGKASYKSLSWTEKGDGLAAVKGVEDKAFEDKLYSLVAWKGAGLAAKAAFDPKSETSFPAGMTISPNRKPVWTEDLAAVSFGIHELRKKKDVPKPGAVKPDAAKPEGDAPAPPPVAAPKDEPDKPDIVIWHHADSRLQSMQQVQERQDKNSSHLCLYWAAEKKFVRLADEKLRQVTLAPKEKFAIGTDLSPYELSGNLNGQRYSDIYVVDVKSGERKLALRKNRYYFGASPVGTHFLYYQDGHYYAYDMAAMSGKNLTEKVSTSFVNSEDDHNIDKPPAFPLGWTADGNGALLSDLWDVWHVPVNGKAVNLTGNGKKEKIRYTSRYRLDPEEKGIDLSKPMYVRAYGEWTKKSGIGLVESGKPGVKTLVWDDASFGSLMKAKSADTYLYTRESNQDYPEYFSSDATLSGATKVSNGGEQQKTYLWSAGTKLIDYTSEKGDKLQGALFLPANYEPGKKYPTIVYIYEKLSQGMNTYGQLTANGFNKSVYTSNGYAVLMPDIKYKINDPGMSAVWCLTPAVKAAVATGVVDPDKVALHGHSWGGYQTAFMITQSNLFKAAIAGAPLTDLISMYSSIYWNTGTTNQPIFESSQGRFTSGYMDNPEPYIRNSPVFHAQNVKTPLMILHNDKDGAVDFTQGIEYYNTLRRLQKNVIMLQYKGENHGLVKPANRKDYTVRMLEFFDYHLKGKQPPKWIEEGVPHLKIKDHIDERVEELTKSEKKPAPSGGGQ